MSIYDDDDSIEDDEDYDDVDYWLDDDIEDDLDEAEAEAPVKLTFFLSKSDDGAGAVTFVDPNSGSLMTLTEDDERFKALVTALVNEDADEFVSVFNEGVGVRRARRVEEGLQRLSDRVSVNGAEVTLDGKALHSAAATTLRRYLAEGRDTAGLVRFIERLDANPSRHAREALWSWIERQGLSVNEYGEFLGYKAIAKDGLSSAAGKEKVYVNGVPHVGRIPNPVGATVRIDRRDVDDDHSKDCSYGLHVGTYAYASTFAPVLTEVAVAPEAVVTVPDYDTNKLRTSEYRVLAVHMPEIGDDLSAHEPPASHDEAVELSNALDDLVAAGEASQEKVTWLQRALKLVKGH